MLKIILWLSFSLLTICNGWVYNLIANKSINSCSTLLHTQSYKLGIKVVSWHQNVSNLFTTCKVCGESLLEDEYHFLFTWSTYHVIRENDLILRGVDNLLVTLERLSRKLSSYAYVFFTHGDLMLQKTFIKKFYVLQPHDQYWPVCVCVSLSLSLSLWEIPSLILAMG